MAGRHRLRPDRDRPTPYAQPSRRDEARQRRTSGSRRRDKHRPLRRYPRERSDGSGSHREGEILARGPNVFSGYRNRPEETGKVFDDGWFRTGDLGYFDDDGYLYVTGRVSTLIVTPGGKNVQPEAVEGAYLENPLIREIGVLQKDGRLVAVIVPETDEIPQGEVLTSAARCARRSRRGRNACLPTSASPTTP